MEKMPNSSKSGDEAGSGSVFVKSKLSILKAKGQLLLAGIPPAGRQGHHSLGQ